SERRMNCRRSSVRLRRNQPIDQPSAQECCWGWCRYPSPAEPAHSRQELAQSEERVFSFGSQHISQTEQFTFSHARFASTWANALSIVRLTPCSAKRSPQRRLHHLAFEQAHIRLRCGVLLASRTT